METFLSFFFAVMRRLLLFVLLCCWGCVASAQHPASVSRDGRPVGQHNAWNNNDSTSRDSTNSLASQGIVYDHKELDNATLAGKVFRFHYRPYAVKIEEVQHPDMEPAQMQTLDPLDAPNNYYLGRGMGQVHYSLLRRPAMGLSASYSPNPNAAYSLSPNRLPLFQTQTPYSAVTFSNSIHKDANLDLLHTQNISPQWNIALRADFLRREGEYTRSGVKNQSFGFTTNYYSHDARYQLQGGIYYQSLRQEENGGVQNDTTCWQTSTRSGVPVNLYAATNQWRSVGIFVHQSYNTVQAFEQLRPRYAFDSLLGKDTLAGYDTLLPAKPRVLNSGVWGMDVEIERHKRNYYDTDPTHFACFFKDTAATFDSSLYHRMAARLYWTNDAYMQTRWQNPWIVTVGITPELTRLPVLDAADPTTAVTQQQYIGLRQESQWAVLPFAESKWRLGKTALRLNGEMVLGSYRNGDHQLSASFLTPIGKQIEMQLQGMLQAKSPEFYFYQYSGNNMHWYYGTDEYEKQQQRHAEMQIAWRDSSARQRISLRGSATRYSNIVLADGTLLRPFTQYNEAALLLQGSLEAALQWRWLHFETMQTLQHTDNSDLLRLPSFVSKSTLYADFPVFHGALRLQTGLSAKYFSRFYADEWNPALGLFTVQNDVEIGGYAWLDAFVTAQIKRACFFVKVVHWNAPLVANPNYFLLPHVPAEDLNVYFGISWKFFD